MKSTFALLMFATLFLSGCCGFGWEHWGRGHGGGYEGGDRGSDSHRRGDYRGGGRD